MVWLLQDLHSHPELSIKLSSAKKITKLLQDVLNPSDQQRQVYSNDEDEPIHVSSTNFRERMYKELRGLTINKKVLEIWARFYDKASDLDESKEDEVTDFLDENGEAKFRAQQEVKKRFTVKIALAKKDNNTELAE